MQSLRMQGAAPIAVPSGTLSQQSSNAISVARVVCIFFMTYVHLHFFEFPAAQTNTFAAIRAILVDFLGRSSVPLLSVVSGFLIVRSIAQHGAGQIVRRRAWMLLLPMVLWNLIWVAAKGPTQQPATAWVLVNDILALTREPALIYLGFLRDVFVLSLLAPLLVRALAVAPWPVFAAAAVIYVFDLGNLVVLRPQILFFFVIGMLMAVRSGGMWQPQRWAAIAIAAAFVLLAVLEGASIWHPALAQIADDRMFDTLLRRPVVAAFAWVLCLWLSGLVLGRWLRGNSDAVFLFFLSHGITFYAIGVVLARIPLFHNVLPYTVAWVLAPVLALAVTVAARRWMMRRPVLARGIAVLEGRV